MFIWRESGKQRKKSFVWSEMMWRTFVWKSTTEIQPYFSSIILQASIRDNDGNTPLHLACKRGDRSCVEALTLPITAKELEDAYKYSEQTMHTHPCTQLPTDLEQRNFDGESSKNFYFLYFRMICRNFDICIKSYFWLENYRFAKNTDKIPKQIWTFIDKT